MTNGKCYFISDTHFFHANVIKFDQRPFADLEEMHRVMIQNWNAKVRKHDRVYIVGDFCWKGGERGVELAKQLNGRLFLVRGNHDKVGEEYRKVFEDISEYMDVPVQLANGEMKRVILCHYFMPFYNGVRRGAVMLHGHTHATEEHLQEEMIKEHLREQGYRCEAYNVGAVHQNYTPWTLDEILEHNKRGE